MKLDPDPFEEGQRAARENIPPGANPYQDGSEQHALWAAGHEQIAGESKPATPKAIDDHWPVGLLSAEPLQALFEARPVAGIEFRGTSHRRNLSGIERANDPCRRP